MLAEREGKVVYQHFQLHHLRSCWASTDNKSPLFCLFVLIFAHLCVLDIQPETEKYYFESIDNHNNCLWKKLVRNRVKFIIYTHIYYILNYSVVLKYTGCPILPCLPKRNLFCSIFQLFVSLSKR